MAAHIAHEVRNPLASIGLNAELLGDEIGGDGEAGRRLIGVHHRRDRSPHRDHGDLPPVRAPAPPEARRRGPRGRGGLGRRFVARRARRKTASRYTWPSQPGSAGGSGRRRPDPAGAHQPGPQRARGDAHDAGRDGPSGWRSACARRRAGGDSACAIRGRESCSRIWNASSTRFSRRKSAAPGWAWRWSSTSSSITAGRSRSRACPARERRSRCGFPSRRGRSRQAR